MNPPIHSGVTFPRYPNIREEKMQFGRYPNIGEEKMQFARYPNTGEEKCDHCSGHSGALEWPCWEHSQSSEDAIAKQ